MGAEILLHGFTHQASDDSPPARGVIERAKARFLTASEGEFQTMPYYRAASTLRQGKAIIEETLGVTPRGFVAPAWLESEHVPRALRALGFEFHEDHLFLFDLRRGRRVFVPAISFTGRSAARARASVVWAHAMNRLLGLPMDIRLALHPADFDHDDLIDAIGELVQEISGRRDWVSYGEYLSLDAMPRAKRPCPSSVAPG